MRLYPSILLVALVALSGGCTPTSASYPPLTEYFGTVVFAKGEVRRGSTVQTLSQSLALGDRLNVLDEIVTGSNSQVRVRLISGQEITLDEGSRWTLNSVVSNGAVYASESVLASGLISVSGVEYMPHQMKIEIPQGLITTFSENISIRIGEETTVFALDTVPVTVSNVHGKVTLGYGQATKLIDGARPQRPETVLD